MRTDGTFQVGPSGNRFLVQTGGNVGIGTTDPNQKLDVAGQIHATGDICTNQGGGVCLSTAGESGGISSCVTRTCEITSYTGACTVSCLAGEFATGGGVSRSYYALSYPSGNGWKCECPSCPSSHVKKTCYVRCCK